MLDKLVPICNHQKIKSLLYYYYYYANVYILKCKFMK